MSKVYNFRSFTINGVTIPANTALKEMGDGAMVGLIRYELPTSLHHCGVRHADLYPHAVGDKHQATDFQRAMLARDHSVATSHQSGDNWY